MTDFVATVVFPAGLSEGDIPFDKATHAEGDLTYVSMNRRDVEFVADKHIGEIEWRLYNELHPLDGNNVHTMHDRWGNIIEGRDGDELVTTDHIIWNLAR